MTSRKRIGYMYPDVSYVYPKCILDSFEIRVKYMQNVKIHVFSWNLTEHVRYVWDTSRYIRIRVSCRIHAGYIRIRILITTPPKLDNKPPHTPLGGAGGRQTADPADALAHRNSPHAGPRSLPTSAWIGFALLYSRLPEKGTKLKPWGAAMIKTRRWG